MRRMGLDALVIEYVIHNQEYMSFDQIICSGRDDVSVVWTYRERSRVFRHIMDQ